ncbi:MAG: 3-phosphoshikimate 1-carboxyvinyltransferase [Bacteroidota bacterium]|nr:3-phosphoshikimate 1-carboxyvinyltransferase [Bacteroidota bacterium]
METTINPSEIAGSIAAPSSKSYLQRAIAAALLTEGVSRIEYHNHCKDSLAAIDIAKKLGADILDNPPYINIKGGFNPGGRILNCDESGLCSRLFSPIAALCSTPLKLTGSGSLIKRPQNLIADSLVKFDVKIATNNDYLPIEICGPLQGKKAIVDGSISSQLISGLLMALPLVKSDSEIEIQNMKSKQYIDMTIEVLSAFGIRINQLSENSFHIPGNQKYRSCDYVVEGDWSAAAFWIIAALISGNLNITGLNVNSQQADAEIIKLLKSLNVDINISSKNIIIKKSPIPAFKFDATNCPDLFPPLVVLAAYANGVSTITGAKRLIYKESNRAKSLQQEFEKLGIKILIEGNTMLIYPGKIRSAIVSSHNDHRIAMALAAASLGARGPVTIRGIESVNKSYPGFFAELANVKRSFC